MVVYSTYSKRTATDVLRSYLRFKKIILITFIVTTVLIGIFILMSPLTPKGLSLAKRVSTQIPLLHGLSDDFGQASISLKKYQTNIRNILKPTVWNSAAADVTVLNIKIKTSNYDKLIKKRDE